jgi:glycosyltransferase involved in cell wall biosynthesis
MKRILLVTQYFYPENFKSNDLAFELVKKGYEVDALVGIPNYPDGRYFKKYGLFQKRIEKVNGVKIYRSFQTPRGKKATGIALSINYLTFAFFASFWALILAIFRKYNYIIVHEPSPITQALPALIVKKIQKIPFYIWVLDIWPDAMTSGGNIKNKKILSSIDFFVKYVYNNSTKILISSKGFANLICRQGDFADKIIYFPNWSEDLLKMPKLPIPELPQGFIIMMAGNLGSAQKLDSVMKAVLELKEIDEIKWVFLGDGSERVWIENFVKENDLTATVFVMGRYPFDTMGSFFNSANAMLLTLNADFPHLKAVVPARLQSYMAAGRPVLAMIDGGGAEIIKESDCGFVAGAADYKSLVDIVRNLVLPNKDNFEAKGMNGRLFFEKHYKKEICINHLVEIIEGK